MIDEKQVSLIVEKVLANILTDAKKPETKTIKEPSSLKGVFNTMEEAIIEAKKAYEIFRNYSFEQREEIITEPKQWLN